MALGNGVRVGAGVLLGGMCVGVTVGTGVRVAAGVLVGAGVLLGTGVNVLVGHTGGFSAYPEAYEKRIVQFFDQSLIGIVE